MIIIIIIIFKILFIFQTFPGLEITTFTKVKTQILYFQALHDYKNPAELMNLPQSEPLQGTEIKAESQRWS